MSKMEMACGNQQTGGVRGSVHSSGHFSDTEAPPPTCNRYGARLSAAPSQAAVLAFGTPTTQPLTAIPELSGSVFSSYFATSFSPELVIPAGLLTQFVYYKFTAVATAADGSSRGNATAIVYITAGTSIG